MSYNNYEKVNWLRPTQLTSGATIAISSKTGVVRVQGLTTQLMGYRDQFEKLHASIGEILRYLEDNKDLCPSKESKLEKAKNERAFIKTVNMLKQQGVSADVLAAVAKGFGKETTEIPEEIDQAANE